MLYMPNERIFDMVLYIGLVMEMNWYTPENGFSFVTRFPSQMLQKNIVENEV